MCFSGVVADMTFANSAETPRYRDEFSFILSVYGVLYEAVSTLCCLAWSRSDLNISEGSVEIYTVSLRSHPNAAPRTIIVSGCVWNRLL